MRPGLVGLEPTTIQFLDWRAGALIAGLQRLSIALATQETNLTFISLAKSNLASCHFSNCSYRKS